MALVFTRIGRSHLPAKTINQTWFRAWELRFRGSGSTCFVGLGYGSVWQHQLGCWGFRLKSQHGLGFRLLGSIRFSHLRVAGFLGIIRTAGFCAQRLPKPARTRTRTGMSKHRFRELGQKREQKGPTRVEHLDQSDALPCPVYIYMHYPPQSKLIPKWSRR